MDVVTGNAELDGKPTRHWIVGQFIPEGQIRHSNEVEIKWGVHHSGDRKSEWVIDETRTTITVLVNGKLEMEFRDKKIILVKPGDYVMWGSGTDHRWRCLDPSTAITIRWPSKV